jgi:hypothetical protein
MTKREKVSNLFWAATCWQDDQFCFAYIRDDVVAHMFDSAMLVWLGTTTGPNAYAIAASMALSELGAMGVEIC